MAVYNLSVVFHDNSSIKWYDSSTIDWQSYDGDLDATAPVFTLESEGNMGGSLDVKMPPFILEEAEGNYTGSLDEKAPVAELLGIGGGVALLEAPVFEVEATGSLDISGSLDAKAPVFGLESYGAGYLDKKAPTASLEATGLSDSYGSLDKRMPAFTLEATGYTELTGSLDKDMPVFTLEATGYTDLTGELDALAPPFKCLATGYTDGYGSLDEKAPVFECEASGYPTGGGELDVNMPAFIIAAVGMGSGDGEGAIGSDKSRFTDYVLKTFEVVMATDRLSIALELRRLAISQYGNFNFESMAVFNGVLIGANADGLYSLFDADDDDGTDIDAIFETITDFGVPSKKKLRRAYIAGEASGDLTFKFKADDGSYKVYTVTPDQLSQLQHRCRLHLQHTQRGNYWMLRVENVAGCDFSIDSVDLLTIILGLGR